MAVTFSVPKKSKLQQPKTTGNPSNGDEDAARVLQWQLIAQAMCYALRVYYLQSLETKDGFISGPVEVLPNGRLKLIRK